MPPTCPQGYPLPDSLRASNDIHEVAGWGEIILMVIPTPFVERTVRGRGWGQAGTAGGCRFGDADASWMR